MVGLAILRRGHREADRDRSPRPLPRLQIGDVGARASEALHASTGTRQLQALRDSRSILFRFLFQILRALPRSEAAVLELGKEAR